MVLYETAPSAGAGIVSLDTVDLTEEKDGGKVAAAVWNPPEMREPTVDRSADLSSVATTMVLRARAVASLRLASPLLLILLGASPPSTAVLKRRRLQLLTLAVTLSMEILRARDVD